MSHKVVRVEVYSEIFRDFYPKRGRNWGEFCKATSLKKASTWVVLKNRNY